MVAYSKCRRNNGTRNMERRQINTVLRNTNSAINAVRCIKMLFVNLTYDELYPLRSMSLLRNEQKCQYGFSRNGNIFAYINHKHLLRSHMEVRQVCFSVTSWIVDSNHLVVER
mmetsp:Transcript_17162/g.47229  ORF Transcript_17162/g.47229 Transcript_17162/m.47229 type:complete len:113 (-) Transcript_17162:491-829(-)